MSNKYYTLNDIGEPVHEPSMHKWAAWMDNRTARIVKKEKVGESQVSTVFLGLDHAWGDDEPPILWETMVFGGALDQEQDRCTGSREQAEAMHAAMVARVTAPGEPANQGLGGKHEETAG